MNDIMYARYLESLNHRLNETLDIIKEHLPVEELEYDQCGKPIFPCCWPLVKILIEINVTAKKLQEGEPEKDDTDARYDVDTTDSVWKSRVKFPGEFDGKRVTYP